MAHLQELANEVGDMFARRAQRNLWLSRAFKVLLLLSAAVAGVAHFGKSDTHHLVGTVASIAVLIFAIAVAVNEVDASTEIEVARKAVDKARELQLHNATRDTALTSAANDLNRASELYKAVGEMRSVLQAVLPFAPLVVEDQIRTMLQVAERSIQIAAGFAHDNHWTLCVYVAEHDSAHCAALLCAHAVGAL